MYKSIAFLICIAPWSAIASDSPQQASLDVFGDWLIETKKQKYELLTAVMERLAGRFYGSMI